MSSGASVSVCKEGVHGPTPPLLKGEHQLGCTWLMIILWVVDFATFPKTCHLMVWHQKYPKVVEPLDCCFHRTSARITNSVTQWPNIGRTGCTQMILLISCKLRLDTHPGCASVHPHGTIDVVYRVSMHFWNLQGAQSTAMTLQPHHLGKRSLGHGPLKRKLDIDSKKGTPLSGSPSSYWI